MRLTTDPLAAAYDHNKTLVSPRDRLYLLKEAYTTEFGHNIRELTREAAEAWARDYSEIWQEYLDNA